MEFDLPGEHSQVPLEAVEARRLYRQVADQLRALIDSGEYAVGSRLPTERDLAEQLKVSRPTVREALIALEVEGRVRIRVGSGIYVSEPASPRARRCRRRRRSKGRSSCCAPANSSKARSRNRPRGWRHREDIERIDAALAAMASVPHPGEASMVHDRAFHVAVAGSLGNAVLVRVVGELFDQRLNPYFAKLAHYFENPETWQAALAEHQAIRDAIAARDPDAAGAAMRKHLARSQERFAQNFGAEATIALSRGSNEAAAEPCTHRHLRRPDPEPIDQAKKITTEETTCSRKR